MKTRALISAVVIFAVAMAPSASSSEERRQVRSRAETCANVGETAFPIPLSKLLTSSCRKSLAEIAAGDLRGLPRVCVPSCVGVACTLFKRLGNKTLTNWCADSVTDLCRFQGKPVRCEGPNATAMEATCAAAARDGPPTLNPDCQAFVFQLLDGGVTDNLEKVCVPNCAGALCGFFNGLGNQTITDRCTDPLTRHCGTVRPTAPNVCLATAPTPEELDSGATVPLAFLGLVAGLLVILIRS